MFWLRVRPTNIFFPWGNNVDDDMAARRQTQHATQKSVGINGIASVVRMISLSSTQYYYADAEQQRRTPCNLSWPALA